jgi:hypothetical protein
MITMIRQQAYNPVHAYEDSRPYDDYEPSDSYYDFANWWKTPEAQHIIRPLAVLAERADYDPLTHEGPLAELYAEAQSYVDGDETALNDDNTPDAECICDNPMAFVWGVK